MSEESVEPTSEANQPGEVQEEEVVAEVDVSTESPAEADVVDPSVAEADVAEAAIAEPMTEVPVEAPAPQPKAQREPLSPQNRWAIFGIAIAVCVVIGIAAPLARALTDEQSILNPSHGALVTETKSSSSSSAAASSSSSSAASSASSSSSSSVATVNSSGDYILPDSATKLYTADELAGLTDYELYLARNEAFAKYGRKFKNDDLTQYFSGKSWYVPTYEPAEFDAMPTPLNDTERANVDLIRQLEAQRNSPYAV